MVQRLGPDDHLFLVMERLMGASTTPHFIWRIPVDPDDPSAVDLTLDRLRRIADGLAAGRLSRRVDRVPGPARDRWSFTPDAGLVSVTDREIPADTASAWVERRSREPLDSVDGPTWSFSAVPTSDAHVLASLMWTHVVSDGASAIRAVVEAVNGADPGADPADLPVDVPQGPPTGRLPERVRDRAGDSLTLLTQAAHAAVHLVRGGLRGRRDAAGPGRGPGQDARPGTPSPDDTGTATDTGTAAVTVPSVTVLLDAVAFADSARAAGGTPNSLFQAVTVGVLAASGRITDGDTVPVSVPISMRADPRLDGDLRANATTGATVPVTVSPELHHDLGGLRATAKEAYRAVTSPGGTAPSTTVALTELAQALPDAVVARLASGATLPLCLASNLGDPGPAFSTLGFGASPVPGRQVTVAPRMSLQAGSRRQLVARRGGLSAWAVQFGSTVALSFTSLDPVNVRDEAALGELVDGELRRWGLSTAPFL